VAISIRAGVLMNSLFGPIPCGCRTVSKMPVGAGVGAGSFGVGAVCRNELVGYMGECCL
jgi:hypothetical protein